jgi:protein-S-isoprenylcysteine O-methyltransferase Ste14
MRETSEIGILERPDNTLHPVDVRKEEHVVMKWVIFAIMSTLIVLKFRKELFSFRQHGAYMFMAAEGLLVLFIFNAGSMFESAFSSRQVFSWALIALSASLALSGFYGLKRYGRAVQDWEDTTRLVQEGVFRYIRHPLYASLMLLAVGMLLKDVSLRAAAACLLTIGFLVAASRAEEGENTAKFGKEYERYTCDTKRYLPFIV